MFKSVKNTMRLAFFPAWLLSHLWSPRPPVLSKIVLVNTVAGREAETVRIVDARFHDRPSVRLYLAPAAALRAMKSSSPLSETVPVPMEGLLDDDRGSTVVVPAFRPASRFHHDAVYAPYAAVLPYDRFLRLEENTASMLIACLHDPRPVRYVFFWRDGCWLSESSLVSYLTSEERRAVFRLLGADTGTIEPVASPDVRVWFFRDGAEI